MFIFINMGIKNRTFNLILRRVDPEYLEKEFIECLDITSNHFLNGFRKSGSVMPLATFRNMTISMTIDAIHWYIHSTTPDDLQWYDDVFYALRKYYDERIEDRYDQIKTKYVINESVIKILREENEEKSSIKKQLQNLIDNIGINRAKIAVGGSKNLVEILYDGDLKKYFQENNIEPYYISSEPNLFIDDLLVHVLDLPETNGSRTEKQLGDFRWTSQGMNYRFTARLIPIRYESGKKVWRVVGSSGDHGFGYSFITKRNTLGKRARMQIFDQIIHKLNLDSYK